MKKGKKAVETYLDTIKTTMKQNEEFIKKNTKEVLEELVFFLSSDVIESVKFASGIKNYSNWAMHSYIISIFQPFSYAIYVDLLTGNLPVCFFEVRVLLEILAKHYLADARYPSHLFFEQKLELLEVDIKEKSISEIMHELDSLLMTGNNCYSLWKEISQNWIHAKGLTKRITNYIVTKQDLPPWALVIPAPYNKNDLADIREFEKHFLIFKKIANEAIKSWKSFLVEK